LKPKKTQTGILISHYEIKCLTKAERQIDVYRSQTGKNDTEFLCRD